MKERNRGTVIGNGIDISGEKEAEREKKGFVAGHKMCHLASLFERLENSVSFTRTTASTATVLYTSRSGTTSCASCLFDSSCGTVQINTWSSWCDSSDDSSITCGRCSCYSDAGTQSDWRKLRLEQILRQEAICFVLLVVTADVSHLVQRCGNHFLVTRRTCTDRRQTGERTESENQEGNKLMEKGDI